MRKSASMPPPASIPSAPLPPRSLRPEAPPPQQAQAAPLEAYHGDADDNEPTRLYASSSSPSAAPPRRSSMPPPSIPTSPKAFPIPAAPVPRPPTGSYKKVYLVAGAAALAAVVLLFVFLKPSSGNLVVTVTGPGGIAVDGIEVRVNGEKRCDASPCRLEELPEGPHLLRASAKGYQSTADQAVSIDSGRPNTLNIELVRESPTGVKVTAIGTGLRLYVDGKEVGELPQTVTDMEQGERVIRVGGNPRYEDWEKRIQVEREAMEAIGPLRLKVKKGLATFKAGPGADGARVLLDGRLIPDLPATIEVPGGKSLTLVATKEGYGSYRRTVLFDEGEAERTFEITMVESGSSGSGSAASTPSAPVSRSSSAAPATRPSPPSSPRSAAGKATVNINSIPVSNVILNGRPLGPTPKVGVQVDAGPQTVVFVHPDHGRKVQSGTVGAGTTKTFMVRFP